MVNKKASENEREKLNSRISELERELADAKKLLNAEKSQKRSTDIYKYFLDGASDAVFIYAITGENSGSFLDVNDLACDMLGYSKKELLQVSPLEICPKELKDVYASDEKRAQIINENKWHSIETTHISQNDKYIPVRVNFRMFKEGSETVVVSFVKNLSAYRETEKALQHEKEFSKKIVEASNAIIMGLDKNHLIRFFNKGAEKITGYEKSEVLGKDWFEIFLPHVEKEKLSGIWSEAWGKKYHSYINPVITKSGDKKIISWQTAGLYEEEDEENHILVSIGIDITDRIKIEKKLKASEKRYRELFEKTEDATLIIENNKFVLCNDATVKMLRYGSKEELLNVHPSELSPEFQPDGKESFKKAEEMMRIALEKGSHRFEWLHKRADGEVFPVEVLLTSISTEEGKSIIHTVWRDITNRKHAERELQKLSKAIVQSPVIVLITNINGRIEYVNPKFSEVTGYTLEEVKNKNPRILRSGYHTQEFYENLWNTILSGKVWSDELRNKKKNGELYWESANISPIKDDDGKITHFIAVKEDITEKKKMLDELIESKKKAENANKMKSIFLAQMSHEIRTPINAMLSLSSLLKDDLEDKVDDETKLSFDLIGRAGMRIIRTIDLLLNLAEIQAGTYEVIFERLDLYADILGKVIVVYKKRIKDKGLKLNIEIETHETEIVVDAYTVEQIFTQLLDNAIKYTNEGEITIKVYRNNEDDLITEITDTGIGIRDEYLSQLFEPFSQEEMGYTRKYEGNGIGLALVKSYCDLNKASIEVESEKGEGSTFRVTFKS